MSHAAEITAADPHRIGERVQHLEDWRKLTVDPKLMQFGKKLEAFERIEQQISGAVRFIRVGFSVVATAAAIVEMTRFVLTMMHLVR